MGAYAILKYDIQANEVTYLTTANPKELYETKKGTPDLVKLIKLDPDPNGLEHESIW